MIDINITLAEGAKSPEYATAGSAGFDLVAHNQLGNRDFEVRLAPGERVLIGTGIYMEIPEGYELQIRPRSGLAIKYGISLVNSPGTIDSDYRGEIGIILINHGREVLPISAGDRIAQAVLSQYEQARFSIKEYLSETKRGSGGFGSTNN